MPSPLLHLQIADRSSEWLDIENESQFFLGSIAPDAIHMGENNTREYKRKLHLTTVDKNISTRIFTALESYNGLKEPFADLSFLKGMYAHVITDHLWSHSISRYYLHDLYGSTPRTIVDKRYYRESEMLENELIKLPNTEKIVDILQKSNSIAYFDLLTQEEVSKWKDKTIELFSRIQTESGIKDKILENELIENFMKLSIEILILFFSNKEEELKNYLDKNCAEHSLIRQSISNKSHS